MKYTSSGFRIFNHKTDSMITIETSYAYNQGLHAAYFDITMNRIADAATIEMYAQEHIDLEMFFHDDQDGTQQLDAKGLLKVRKAFKLGYKHRVDALQGVNEVKA